MRNYSLPGLVLLTVALAGPRHAVDAEVVINEVFYNAPDDLQDLEYIELFNTGTDTINLSGWRLAKGVVFTFPKASKITGGEYVVICKDAGLLHEFYRVDAVGEFSKSLSNKGDQIVLADNAGRTVESVTYTDRPPWPTSADGYSASLERICASAAADNTANWAPSTLSDNYGNVPSGTPGRKNSVAATVVPPTMGAVTWEPDQPKPGTELSVHLQPKSDLQAATLFYRLVSPGDAGQEQSIAMVRDDAGQFSATISTGNRSNRLLRFRIAAAAENGGVANVPAANDLRPAYTVYVNDTVEVDHIPVLQFFHVGKEAFAAGEEYRRQQSRDFIGAGDGFRGFGGPPRGGFGRGRGGFDRGRRFGGPGFGGWHDGPPATLMPQGPSAVIYTEPQTGISQVFDFVNVVERKSGWKLRFHKDRPLLGMTTMNLLYEPNEETILNESPAYELYRLAGNASYLNGYMRLVINGQPAGYHLYFEQPNSNFFRRNEIEDDGDLYKLIWMGNAEMSSRIPIDEIPKRQDIAGRHEKITNPHKGYQELVDVIEKLERAATDGETWKIILTNFDLENVINYFAVNSLLSHWDGFFNNYFLYFDRQGTGKWSMYPWDQDSTWSQRGGRPEDLYEMPLFFGAEGATPDGLVRVDPRRRAEEARGPRGFGGSPFGRSPFGGRGFGGPRGGRGFGWWRPGGDISRPLLANPEFYQRFQTRLRELASTVFTEEVFGPKLDDLRSSLEPEVRLRARLRGSDQDQAVRELDRTIEALREHLSRRRAFVMSELAN